MKTHLITAVAALSGAGLVIAAVPFAAPSSGSYDYSHRMRNCDLSVKLAGQMVSGKQVEVRQTRNHFGFGASINRWAFDTLGPDYGEAFLKYFDMGTPENEMKWEYVHKQDTVNKTEPDYTRADYLVEFLQKNDIAIRGHNLFWNEHTGWIPKWTYTLTAPQFKEAMAERIASAMGYFKGKVVQWDVINEIVHGRSGSTPATTMLDSATGDPNIFKWILEEARKVDPDPKFVINDYNLIEQYDVIDKFVAKVKPLANYYDIVGCEGHFQEYLEKSGYEPKINKLAQQLGKRIWLTEVDFTITSNRAAKVEELMRTCFANRNVEGLIFWVWCKRRMWRENLSSYFVDSLLQETDVGKKWREVREEWKTKVTKAPDASGKLSFNGYQGKYTVSLKEGDDMYIDTFYLEPGSGTKTVEVNLEKYVPPLHVESTGEKAYSGSHIISVNGRPVILAMPIDGGQLYLSTFSVSGRLLLKVPFTISNSAGTFVNVPAGCHVFRIHTADWVCYTGMGVHPR
ncbi:MAG: endo-1,4-beta-xylanase [Chitinispirillaceae bacterium]|nr:endo-1,4-beta-xylanase [Chitinispirillaceae bacterium]